jgi:carbonic anhydrase/acetyltransferase-like protein (isoleucine patch superfamily)
VGFTNDRFPRSRQWPAEYARTLVKRGASIGANASILPGLTIGSKAMIGAGVVVTRDVPAHKALHQFLVWVSGNCAVRVNKVSNRRIYLFNIRLAYIKNEKRRQAGGKPRRGCQQQQSKLVGHQ